MNLLYKSTRNAEKTVTASEAILKGLADDGGLFVPVTIPKLNVDMGTLKEMSYQETAYAVMKQFFTDFTEETFCRFIENVKGLKVKCQWITGDARSDRSDEKWLNLILIRG